MARLVHYRSKQEEGGNAYESDPENNWAEESWYSHTEVTRVSILID